MKKWIMGIAAGMVFLLVLPAFARGGEKEIAGVRFPTEKVVAGKTLKLNGVALRRAYIFVKVFAGAFYLEHPTRDATEAIKSDQIKQFDLRYLTDKATAKKLQEGFIEAMEKANPPELVTKHHDLILRYASWLDKDMKPGATSVSTYIPGKGLTLWLMGEEKGTISDPEFIQMYYRYSLGKKADQTLRKGYMGLK